MADTVPTPVGVSGQSTKATFICEVCGVTFARRRRSRDAARCCSRECGFALMRVEGAKSRAVTAEKVVYRKWAARWAKACQDCGERISARRKRCEQCADAHGKASWREYYVSAKDVTERACAECLTVFSPHRHGDKRRAFCSAECGARHHRRVGKGKERASRYGVAVDAINPIAIMERDGWRCHLCGGDAPRDLRGTMAWNAPEMDHIIPLAAGGPHTVDNVACAHRACNVEKGDRLTSGMPDAVPERRWTH